MTKASKSDSKPVNPALEKRDYRVTVAGWVAGQRAAVGDIVQLTERQARHEHVELAAAATKSKATDAK